MIVITGATGALNGATADHLLTTLPASEIAVVARDAAKAQRFADQGVEVRVADLADASTLPAAFAGADQLLLVSSSDPAEDGVALHRQAIEAAVAAASAESSTRATRAPRSRRRSARGVTTRRPSSCSPTRVSPGPRCATASTPTAWPGCSARGARPV